MWCHAISPNGSNPFIPDDRENVTNAFIRVQEQADVVVKEYRVVRPDGGVRWIQNTCFPILDESGRVQASCGHRPGHHPA